MLHIKLHYIQYLLSTKQHCLAFFHFQKQQGANYMGEFLPISAANISVYPN